MSSWRIHTRYGHGAARIPLCPDAYRLPREPLGLGEGMALAWREMRHEGHRERLSHVGGSSAVAGFVLLFAIAMVVALTRGTVDDSAVQIVAFHDDPPPVPAVEVPISPEPLPEPEPVVPEPPPPPPEVARVEPPPPPPPVAPKPKTVARPKPVARPEAPKPPPPERLQRRPRVEVARRPEPARPAVNLDALARAPEPPAPRPERLRPNVPNRPRVAPPPPVAVDPLSRPSVPEPPKPARVQRPQLARPAPTPAPRPELAVEVASLPSAPSEAPVPRFRRAVNKAPSPSAPSRPAPRFDLGTPGAPAAPVPGTAPARVQRARVPTPARETRPTMAAAGLGVPGMGRAPTAPPPPLPAAPGRAPTPAPGVADRDRQGRTRDPRLRGVPLGSLAACVSDRLEDSLKQKLLAAVTTQEECVSDAGTYRFVETRNLNSFLMTIERAGNRAEGDRCTELRHALECLN